MDVKELDYDRVQAILIDKERAIAAVEDRIREIEEESAALLSSSIRVWRESVYLPRTYSSTPIPEAIPQTIRPAPSSLVLSNARPRQDVWPHPLTAPPEDILLAPRLRAFIVDHANGQGVLDQLGESNVKLLPNRLRSIGFTQIFHHHDVKSNSLYAIITSLLRFIEQSHPDDAIFIYLKCQCTSSSLHFDPDSDCITFEDFASIFETTELATCQIILVLDAEIPMALLQRLSTYLLVSRKSASATTRRTASRIEEECCKLHQVGGESTASQLARINSPFFVIARSCSESMTRHASHNTEELFVQCLSRCLFRSRVSILDFHRSIISELATSSASRGVSPNILNVEAERYLPCLGFHEAFAPNKTSCFSKYPIIAPEKPSWLPAFSSSASTSTRELSIPSGRRMLRLCDIHVRLSLDAYTHELVPRHLYLSLRHWSPQKRGDAGEPSTGAQCRQGPSECLTQVRRLRVDDDQATVTMEDGLFAEIDEDMSQSNFLIEVFGRGNTPHFFKAAFVMLEGQNIKAGLLELMLSTENTTSAGAIECNVHLTLE